MLRRRLRRLGARGQGRHLGAQPGDLGPKVGGRIGDVRRVGHVEKQLRGATQYERRSATG